MAIPVETPVFPLTSFDRVWRATPRCFAASVTDKPRGCRHCRLTIAPGCGGFCMAMTSLPNDNRGSQRQPITFVKSKDNPPVSGNRTRIMPVHFAFSRWSWNPVGLASCCHKAWGIILRVATECPLRAPVWIGMVASVVPITRASSLRVFQHLNYDRKVDEKQMLVQVL